MTPHRERQKPLADQVRGKAERRLRAQGRRPNIFFGLGLFGVIGWSVAVPTVAGTALGLWIDHHWPSHVSWTLTLLFAGVVLGCLNAWHWVRRETERQQTNNPKADNDQAPPDKD